MLCERCHLRPAIERDGEPARCLLFGEIDGYFCPECLRELQQPHEEQLRRDIAARAPDLSEADLAAVPDQMLKFTLCLPIPRGLPSRRG
ncbi:MAG TPA: hypothetical protein VMG41_00545 [Gemmatimonadales bacterium]|nr:hypothetical protein [Gemmatimonadales bacterium]